MISVIGSAIVIAGLYFLLWGKNREMQKVVHETEEKKEKELSFKDLENNPESRIPWCQLHLQVFQYVFRVVFVNLGFCNKRNCTFIVHFCSPRKEIIKTVNFKNQVRTQVDCSLQIRYLQPKETNMWGV